MTLADLRAALDHANVQAFLRVIREKESAQDDSAYFMRWPGKTFTDLSAHPNILEPIPGTGLQSSAAGAYQITGTTWRALCAQYPFPDFSRPSQDWAAVALVAGRGALQDVLAGRLDAAIAKCRKEWTSLPGAAESRASWTMDKARALFLRYGGGESAPPKLTQRKDQQMPFLALLSAFGPLIAQLIPQIAKAVGGGDRAQQNVAAAEAIFNTVVAASGQPNIQSAVEAMQADPTLVETVTKAVVTDPQIMGLMEIGGGVKAAREASIVMQNAERTFLRNPAFWVSVLLLIMPYMLLIDVYYVHPNLYDGPMRTQINTGILAVIMMVGGFWIGSSLSSQSKDATIDRAVK